MSKTALITGATGFVGSHLARRLVKDGWTVHAIVRSSSKRDLIHDIEDSIYFHIYNGTVDSMQEIFAESRPDTIFHLASLFLSQHQPQDITALIQSNITFGTHLAEAAVANDCFQFINTGTSWQHYENEDYNPVNLYAATKQAFEDILKYYVEAHALKVVTLKLFDTYGPDDPRPKLMNLLKRAAETGETLEMSPGEQLIDLVHVDDVVEAFCTAQELIGKMDGSVMNDYGISSNNPRSLRDIVTEIENELGKKITVHWGGKPYRIREVMIPWNSSDSIPGWFIKDKNFIR
ncbi:NAD-dependent epimerase/dehydratase family protein [Desulfoplanes sp. PS50]